MWSLENAEEKIALERIAKEYGEEQFVKLAEECDELAIASMRHRAGRDSNLEEEMADVLVVMWQVAFLANISPDVVRNIAHDKILRTLRRIEAEHSRKIV